jgi:hypothetical protein
MSYQTAIRFKPTPPPPGKSFYVLRSQITDAGGTEHTSNMNITQINDAIATQQPAPDGSYELPITFNTNVAVGSYSGQSQALDAQEQPMGSAIPLSGTVGLNEGAWYPQPVASV